MRLLIEIILIIAAGIFIFKLTEENAKLSSDNKQLRQENRQYEYQVDLLQDSLEIKEQENDSLKDRKSILLAEIKNTEKEKNQVENFYQDSLDEIAEKTLEELVGDTGKIIEKGNSSYALVSEKKYRKFKKNEVELRKVKSLYGICQKQVKEQKELIATKNLRIDNYKKQLQTKDKQLHLKDSIIGNKDKEIDNLEKENKRQKWFKRGAVGAAIIIGILAL